MRVNVISIGADGKPAVPDQDTLQKMGLSNLAALCREDWDNVYFGAVPYLNALASLDTLDDQYGLDPAEEVVVYFLSNAQTWRGELARAVKAELKRRLKERGV